MTADEAKQALKEGKKVRPVNVEVKISNLNDLDYYKLKKRDSEAVFKIFKDDEWEIVE